MTRLANLLGALALAITDDLRDAVGVDGLGAGDAAALNVIGHTPGCSIGFVADSLGLTHGGAVRTVDRLAAAGLALRSQGPDHRTVGLELTTRGSETWSRVRAARGGRLDALVGTLSATERRAFEQAVERMLVALTDDETGADRICRLCDESACPQDRCPVTCAIAP